jgi:hypothetical protein
MAEFRHISYKEGRVSFENGFGGGGGVCGGSGVSKLNIYEVLIRSTYPFNVCVRIAGHHRQANSNLVCCLWKYCLCALIKQTPFFGVLLVLLLECIDQANTQSCVCCWCYCLCVH